MTQADWGTKREAGITGQVKVQTVYLIDTVIPLTKELETTILVSNEIFRLIRV